ncbi:MAG: hypothetical protein HPY57_13635 [Ignavibacteria bacterium]|nr:hypothetical protein [Ignavibacteria bacterium]
MENNIEKRWIAKKIGPIGEYKEEVTYGRICELIISPNFMQMIQRMQVGEIIFYNEKNIEFQRIK